MAYLKFKQLNYDTKICEICGIEFVADYGYSLAVCWLITGHANIGGFMCPYTPGNQHWGCTPEHALEAAIQCANEHMLPQIKMRHEAAKSIGITRIAEEHQHFIDENVENFHHIANLPKSKRKRKTNVSNSHKV